MDDTFRLDQSVVHLNSNGPIHIAPNGPEFWADRTRPELACGQVVTVFGYDVSWDWQERHPTGDEIAVLLTGSIDVVIDAGAGEHAIRLEPQCGAVIKEGAWHRVVVYEPSTILFITPEPARTEHRSV